MYAKKEINNTREGEKGRKERGGEEWMKEEKRERIVANQQQETINSATLALL